MAYYNSQVVYNQDMYGQQVPMMGQMGQMGQVGQMQMHPYPAALETPISTQTSYAPTPAVAPSVSAPAENNGSHAVNLHNQFQPAEMKIDDHPEVHKLRSEVSRLNELLEASKHGDASGHGKGPKVLISDFHSEEDDNDPWYDIFGMIRRLTPSRSPYHKEILEKYQGYGALCGFLCFMDHFFAVTERKTGFFTEFYGGMTIFFAMCYIIALNPIIVSGAIGAQYKPGLFFATCLSAGVFTLIMGLLANIPVALAPGMGLNGYFANVARVAPSGILVGILTWQQGMAAVFLSGILYLVLTISGLRFLLFKAVPLDLRHAMSAGIGLFICTIGYKIGSIFGISYYGGPMGPVPQIIPFYNYDIVMIPLTSTAAGRNAIVGLMFVAMFMTMEYKAGILCSIILTTFCGIVGDGTGMDTVTSLSVWHQSPIPFLAETGNLLAGHLDFSAAGKTEFWDVCWTFIFVEMFDSFGTLSTIMMKSGIGAGNVKKADRNINNAMLIDGWGLLFGSLVGSNSITPFIESLTGIVAGARTGFAAVVVGVLFLLSLLFVYPFIAIIPDSATLPALFMVGVYSISEACHVDWEDFPTAFTSFLMIITMPLTYSIANGIAAGFIFYNWTMYVRFLWFRAAEWKSGKSVPKGVGPQGRIMPWEMGWNPENPKDRIPHWVMTVFGIFMCLRYRYFF